MWVDLNLLSQLTYNLDFEAGCGFPSLILQDYFVVASVFPLCDINCQACLVTIGFSSDTLTCLKNHLETAREAEVYFKSRGRICCILCLFVWFTQES